MASGDEKPASTRRAAKAAVASTDPKNSKIDVALDEAKNFNIELVREQNRHIRDLAQDERGRFGYYFGNERHAPTYIALLAILIGLGIGVGCLIAAARDSSNADFWSKQAERGFAFAGTALGFVFGRSTK